MKKDELERASRFNNSAMVTDKDSLLKRREVSLKKNLKKIRYCL